MFHWLTLKPIDVLVPNIAVSEDEGCYACGRQLMRGLTAQGTSTAVVLD
jgi:hypothetical protein